VSYVWASLRLIIVCILVRIALDESATKFPVTDSSAGVCVMDAWAKVVMGSCHGHCCDRSLVVQTLGICVELK
jgi:hypothetical protein